MCVWNNFNANDNLNCYVLCSIQQKLWLSRVPSTSDIFDIQHIVAVDTMNIIYINMSAVSMLNVYCFACLPAYCLHIYRCVCVFFICHLAHHSPSVLSHMGKKARKKRFCVNSCVKCPFDLVVLWIVSVSDVYLCIVVVVVNFASFSFIILQTRNFLFIRLDCALPFTHRTPLIVIILYCLNVWYAVYTVHTCDCVYDSLLSNVEYTYSTKSNCIIHHLPPFTNGAYTFCSLSDEPFRSISCDFFSLPFLHLFVLHLIEFACTQNSEHFLFSSLYGMSIFEF